MRFTALFFLFATASVGAFVPQQHVVDPISKTSTERAVATNQAPATSTDVTNISYGEQSRQYRRTVYTHDENACLIQIDSEIELSNGDHRISQTVYTRDANFSGAVP